MLSEMYPVREPLPDRSTGRACGICGGSTGSKSVFMPNAGIMVCKSCSQSLYDALSPRAQTIPVHPAPQAGRRGTMRKAGAGVDTPFDVESFKRELKYQFAVMFLAYAAAHKDSH